MTALHGDHFTGPRLLLRALAQNWWMLLLRGICAMAFGVLAVIHPAAGVLALVFIYGAYAFVDGIVSIIAAVTRDAPGSRLWLAVSGIISLIASGFAFLWPGITAAALLWLIGLWAIATGIAHIVGAIRLRKEIDHEWLLLLGGVISVLFGAVVILSPGASAVALVLIIGVYAILFGALLSYFAWRLHSMKLPSA